ARLRALVAEVPSRWDLTSPAAAGWAPSMPAPTSLAGPPAGAMECDLLAVVAAFPRLPSFDRAAAAATAESRLLQAERCRRLDLLFLAGSDAAETLIARGDLRALRAILATWDTLPKTVMPAAAATFELQRADAALRMTDGTEALVLSLHAR